LAAGLSQAELAERAGLSPDGISALESGRRATPRPFTVRALAEALALADEDRLQLFAAAQAGTPIPEALPIPDLPAAGGERGPLSSPPQPPTRLIGREREVAAIAYALRSGQARLMTLTGPGGVGKTRLALAVATAVAADFPDGVVWVELAQIIGPAQEASLLVAGAIARALGTREPVPQAVAASLAAAIDARTMLLVLDNFEHVLAAGPLVAALLEDCPALALLVTSRERLHLRGEREFVVQPLAVPNPEEADGDEAAGVQGVAAIRLFVERAVEVRSDFALTAANTAAVVTICRQLDGLPLAIELAVRWVKVLPPEALAERLLPRLPLLAGGGGDRPDRQQTMRDTIAWSYQLLQPEEQSLFRRLGVFAGGFTLEAAEAVGGDYSAPATLALVAALVDKSLVRLQAGAATGPVPRFGMLETIREFALEQLATSGEAAETRAAHAHYCTHLVETLRRPAGAQKGPLDRLQDEHANVRAALEWLDADGPGAAFVHLASLLPGFWSRGGHLRAGRTWLERALAKAEVAAADDRGRVQAGLGLMLTWLGELEAAEPLFAAGILLLRASGSALDLATALNWHGTLVMFNEDHARAEVMFSEALALVEAAADQPGAIDSVNSKASALANLGMVALRRGDYALAETRLAEALRLRDAHGFDLAAAVSVVGLAAVAYAQGNYQRAITRYREALVRFGERGEQHHVASALAGMACSAAALGRPRAAARLFGAEQTVLERAGMRVLEPAWQATVDRHRAVVQGALGEDAFGIAWAEGRALSWSALMDEVAALSESATATPPTLPAPVQPPPAPQRLIEPRQRCRPPDACDRSRTGPGPRR
jgi:predicted ATPase/transcriptional regulator with XRE-family HTH domain